jgi:hypothetical protein
MSERMDIHLRFSDWDLGQSVADSSPPDGVSMSKPAHSIEASEPAQIFLTFTISFASGVASKVVADWLLARFKKSGKKSSSINRQEVVFEERHVVRFVEEEVSKYYRYRSETHQKEDDDAG